MLKKNKLIILICMALSLQMQSQEFEISKLEYLVPLEGSGGTNALFPISNKGWITIENEVIPPLSVSLGFPPDWNEPHALLSTSATHTVAWTEDGNTLPVAYVSGYIPRIKATFIQKGGAFACNSSNSNVWIRGKWVTNGPSGDPPIIIGPIKAIVSGTKASIGPVPFNFTFSPQGEVLYREKFTIQWEYAFDENSSDWKQAGNSENKMYGVHKTPTGSSSGSNPPSTFYTPLHISCSAANGHSYIKFIVDKIYDKFTGRCVSRYTDFDCMKYWGTWASDDIPQDPFDFSLWAFLYHKDGRCGSWGPFFAKMLQLQGVTYYFNLPTPLTSNPDPYECYQTFATAYNYHPSLTGTIEDPLVLGLLISRMKDYFGSDFDENHPFDKSKSAYIFDGHSQGVPTAYIFVKDWNFIGGENQIYSLDDFSIFSTNGIPIVESDLQGVSGQGNPDPRSSFNNHDLVVYDNIIYDPSYGTESSQIYSNQNQVLGTLWTNSSISGIGCYVVWNNKVYIWVHKSAQVSSLNSYIKFN